MRFLLFILSSLLLISCIDDNRSKAEKKKSHPSHSYNYIDAEKVTLQYFETDYVPVYSDIYHRDGTKRFQLTTTISIRNISQTDSAYILSATYHDSYGKELNEYADSAILLSPLESIEFVVEEVETSGGAGANFIVKWGATNYSKQLLIQSIMIGTYGQQGISFLSEARVISNSGK
jgi:hypothetical protein